MSKVGNLKLNVVKWFAKTHKIVVNGLGVPLKCLHRKETDVSFERLRDRKLCLKMS